MSHLLLDADDTLWENHLYFELAVKRFVEFLGHSRLAPSSVRAILDQIESANSDIHGGYGAIAFSKNLCECYERLAEHEVSRRDLARVAGFGERILRQPARVFDGVIPTLQYLAGRHELSLLTKGDPTEQERKVARSELGSYFDRVIIVEEKDADVYRKTVEEHDADPKNAWMIGNSPKSDINPALEAGLNAVYIPHPRTWRLEKQQVCAGSGRLLTLDEFSDLRDHF